MMSANNLNAASSATNAAAPPTQQPQPVTATIKSRPNIMPSNYMYTSSSALLNRNNNSSSATSTSSSSGAPSSQDIGGSGSSSIGGLIPGTKPTPPPTLPKYTSSFNAGSASSALGRDRDKDGIGGSYRLSSLDRLAMRQKFMDQQQNNSSTTINNSSPTNGTLGATQNGGGDLSGNNSILQSKRDMFFSTTDSVTLKDSNRLGKTPSLDKPPEPPLKTSSLSSPSELSKEDSLSTLASKESTPEIVKERPKPKELDGYVGFANLPNQVYRKAVKKGFEFTLMVVGESGLGKSTLINSMFLTEIYNSGDYPGPTQRLKKTVAVETTRVMLKENGVNLLLTMVDTPGFGDAVDNSNCWAPVIEYIESKYEDYLNSEARVTRKQLPDQRVHCCLYFIQPSGHGLKSLDIEFMKRLCDKVNIVPVIAKADTLTSDECATFKRQILTEIAQHKIKIYEFPDALEEDEEHKLNKTLKDRVPFAVVGSNTVIEGEGGKKIRGRKYPWGIAEVENLEHCDFIALRNMIIRTHLQDLKDVTNDVHYENYRCRKLAGLGVDGKPSRISNKNPLAQMDEEKREHDLKMKKMEAEMEQVFEMKVREKKQKLKDSESELTRRHEATKKQLEQQAKELEEKRRQFEMEKEQWERENQITVEELRRRSLEGSREAVDGKKEKKKKGLF